MIQHSIKITDWMIRLKMLLAERILLSSLNADTSTPDICQIAVLRRILHNNKNTEFGKQHHFSSITTVDDFINTVPVQDYEKLRPYIEEQIRTGHRTIVPEKPIMYAQTSGTTGKPKYVPILKATANAHKRAQRIFALAQYKSAPKVFSGKILAIVSPAVEGYLSNGTPYGSISGLMYRNMPDIISSKYVLPHCLFEIADYETKYRLISAFALCEENITCLATANPSTLLRISDTLQNYGEALIEFIATGNIDVLDVMLSSEQKEQIDSHIMANPQRAKILKSIKKTKGKLYFSDVWMNLQTVAVWTSGNCALLLPKLKNQLSPKTKIIEMGYLSSEFRGSITIDCEKNLGLPTLQDNFFEFAEVNSWDNGNQKTFLLSQLQTGKKYYIIVTTQNGLYRYFINDIIEVTGHYHNTPTIAFIQKGKGVTNLTGEKLYESQIISAVCETANAENILPEFFIMLADQENFSYQLYIETKDKFNIRGFTEKLNTHLGRLNIEYQSKVQSNRITLASVKRLKAGTFEIYKLSCIQTGQREGQFKMIKLQYRTDVPFSFEEYIEA